MKIESNIPVPDMKGVGRSPLYPFREMKINQSILIKGNEKKRLAARRAAHVFGLRNSRKYVTRTVDAGIRIWRIE